MEQNKENAVGTTENLKNRKPLATEMVRNERGKHKMKNLGLWLLAGVAATAIICGSIERRHLVSANLQNDREWRQLFSDYDFISQDGEGINSINTGKQGDLINEPTGEVEEGQNER